MEVEAHILLLDDDLVELELIETYFKESGLSNYKGYTNAELFIKEFHSSVYLAIIDWRLGRETAEIILDTIKRLCKERDSLAQCETIVISGTEDIKVPVYLMNTKKADYFLLKKDASFYQELVVYAHKAIDKQKGWARIEQKQHGSKEFYNSLKIPDERR